MGKLVVCMRNDADSGRHGAPWLAPGVFRCRADQLFALHSAAILGRDPGAAAVGGLIFNQK
jgi:hypothetical protein